MSPVAFVTGSTRGIGRAIALDLARAGFAVAVNGRRESAEMDQTISMLQKIGAPAVGIAADLSDPATHDPALQQVEASLGPITALVCNAGVGPLRRVDLLEAGPDSFDHCIAGNTRGPFFLAQAHARRLLSRARPAAHHSVIFISSANAEATSLGKADYCVSKAGLAMVAKLFAMKLCPLGIQVADIRPGIIETALSAAVIDGYRQRVAAGEITLTPRVGQPEDIASAVRAIATGQLPYLAGSVLQIDGGLSMARF